MEIWKTITELNGRYEVSNMGNIRKIEEIVFRKNGRQHTCRPKTLRPIVNKYGYFKVRCRITKGVCKNVYIHAVVAKYFCEGHEKGLQVNHINGKKEDNSYSNLEWVTCRENIHHAWEIGLSSNDRHKKPVIVHGRRFNSYTEAAKDIGVSRQTVSDRIRSNIYSSQ